VLKIRGTLAVLAFAIAVSMVQISLAKAADGKLTQAHLKSWLARYEKAWETRSADAAAKLFTSDASYRENPFEPAFQGRTAIHKYWADVTTDQRDVDFTSAIVAVTARTGVAKWHAEFKQASSGARVVLDGVFVLEFAADGLCRDLQEWWHLKTEPAGK
jgi:nuclear transport factor 2 (NTF2) superfamily protein